VVRGAEAAVDVGPFDNPVREVLQTVFYVRRAGSWIRQNGRSRTGKGSWSLARLLDLSAAGPAEISGRSRYDGSSPAGIRPRAGAGRFLAIEFPAGRLTASGFEQLLSLADRGVVEILDMEFIVKDADGKSKKVTSGSSPFPTVST